MLPLAARSESPGRLCIAVSDAAGWAVSAAMAAYFGYYFWRLATWPMPVAAASMEQSTPR